MKVIESNSRARKNGSQKRLTIAKECRARWSEETNVNRTVMVVSRVEETRERKGEREKGKGRINTDFGLPLATIAA